MIGFLEGKIELNTERYVVINVNSVGYKVFISTATFKNLPEKDEKVKLHTHLHVREDVMELYGFLSIKELEFFELLISISGIGPKGALNILNVASVDTLKRAIVNEESSILTKVSGIGKKTAEKIILELKKVWAITSNDIKQVLRYLEATNLKLSIIANFKHNRLQYRQVLN